MTRPSPRLLRSAVTLVLLVAAGWLGWLAFRPPAPGLGRQIEATAIPSRTDGVHEIVVVAEEGGLHPNVLWSQAGRPLRVVVRSVPGRGGPDRLLVPELGIAADLAAGGDTPVTIPPAPRGAFPITDRDGRSIGALRFQ